MKKTLGIGLFIGLLAILVGSIIVGNSKKMVEAPVMNTEPNQQPLSLCFYHESKTTRGFYDRALLRLNIDGSNVTGEYRNLPAESDSKVGTFTGTVGPVDKIAMARTADVWWDSMAEGMRVTEQLKIVFGEGSAAARFGEMVDRGDGTYVYKDDSKLTNGFMMTDVACSDLDDRLIVESYVRANIGSIAPIKPVLGGTWYVTAVQIDPSKDLGTVSYEDGHIAGSASFRYERTGQSVMVTDIVKLK
jgi:hypothetical protein